MYKNQKQVSRDLYNNSHFIQLIELDSTIYHKLILNHMEDGNEIADAITVKSTK